MKFIKAFNSKSVLDSTVSSIKHGDGTFVFGVSTAQGVEDLTLYDQRHPGLNCVKLQPVNMSPVKLDSSSTKNKPAVGDVLYSTADGKLTLDEQTNSVDNTAIAICVIPEVLENFNKGDQSYGAVKTARFVSINYMDYDTPATGIVNADNKSMRFGNYGVKIGNVKGGTDETSYIGGKWNTQQCLSNATKQDPYICNGITNASGIGYCAPACCCVAYSTLGTKPGDWYLPSVGELYQIYANNAVNEKRKTLVGSIFKYTGYWSCREINSGSRYDSLYEYNVSFYTGKINNNIYKESYCQVLAFLAVEV